MKVLQEERFTHPHPRVQRKMEAVYLTGMGLPRHEVYRSQLTLDGFSESAPMRQTGQIAPRSVRSMGKWVSAPPGVRGGVMYPFSSVGAEGILRDAAGTPAVVVMRPKKRLAGGAVTVTHGVAGAGERGRGRDPEAQQPQMEFHRYANCINQDMEKGRGIGPV